MVLNSDYVIVKNLNEEINSNRNTEIHVMCICLLQKFRSSLILSKIKGKSLQKSNGMHPTCILSGLQISFDIIFC